MAAPLAPEQREDLVLNHARLASCCVRRFLARYRIPAGLGLEKDDLVSEAFIALCRAADGWDPQRGAFTTYATAAIHNWLLNVCRLDRSSRVQHLQTLSLDHPISDNEEERLMDLLPDAAPEVADTIHTRLVANHLREAIAELPDRDRTVMLSLLQGQNAASIAREHGCTRQRIDQIQTRAFRRLRRRLRELIDGRAD